MSYYNSVIDLLVDVQNRFPRDAEEIYQEAYGKAWRKYEEVENKRGLGNREVKARRIAWQAVKDKYEKDGHGKWHKKS